MLLRVYWCYSYIHVAHLSLDGASVRATALTMTRYYFTMGDAVAYVSGRACACIDHGFVSLRFVCFAVHFDFQLISLTNERIVRRIKLTIVDTNRFLSSQEFRTRLFHFCLLFNKMFLPQNSNEINDNLFKLNQSSF